MSFRRDLQDVVVCVRLEMRYGVVIPSAFTQCRKTDLTVFEQADFILDVNGCLNSLMDMPGNTLRQPIPL